MAGSSTYSIDLSKKCVLKYGEVFNATSLDKIPASFYGDLDNKVLNNLGFEFIEDFHDGNKYTEEEVEKMLKPVTAAMQAVVKQIPLMKNVDVNTKNLRDSAIFLWAIYSSIKNGNDIGKTAKDLFDNFDYQYQYNLPMRGSGPKLNPVGGSKITINFAYGKCNMFSAKKEVWEPLIEMQRNFFPAEAYGGKKGLIQVTGTATGVPFPQQVTIEVLNTILSKAIEGVKGADNRALSLIQPLKNIATSLEATNSIQYEVEQNYSTGLDFDKKDTAEAAVANVKEFLRAIEPDEISGDFQKVAGEPLEAYINDNLEEDEHPDLAGALRRVTDKISEAAQQYAAAENRDAKLANNTLDPLKIAGISDGGWGNTLKKFVPGQSDNVKYIAKPSKVNVKSHTIQLPNRPVDDNTPSVESIVKNLINYVPITVGEVTSKLAKPVADNALSLHTGFPNIYRRDLNELWQELCASYKTSEQELKARVVISSFLIKKASIKFDFNNVDEMGYPMSGQFTIDEIWNIKYPGDTLRLSTVNISQLKEDVLEFYDY